MVSLHDVFAEPALSRPPVTIAATDQATYLEDMAKAEALDAMGDTECAVAMVDRHV